MGKERQKHRLLRDPLLRELPYAEAAKILGVSASTIYRWRDEAGLKPPKLNTRYNQTKEERQAGMKAMREDTAYWVEDGRSKYALPHLRDKYNLSIHKCRDVMTELGVLPSVSQNHRDFKDFLPAISEEEAANFRVLQTWGRPKGMDAHLEALNER